MKKIEVAVLGATGMIGQRFVQLLEDHPYFKIGGLYASERSEGKTLAEVLKVKDVRFQPETLGIKIEQLDPKAVSKRCRAAFSGLPTEVAKDTESSLAELGVAVFSNAASHRMRDDVPLLIPEVNPDHLEMVRAQPSFVNGGFIVTNANCSTTGLAVPLQAIYQSFGMKACYVSTYQAVSGAGYPGVPSLDIMGNVVPFIKNEEEKMEEEIHKMLGTIENGRFKFAEFEMVASCARVPVIDGHLESAVLKLGREATAADVSKALENFRPEPQRLNLPTAPTHPIIVRKEDNRPQPATDALAGEPERARGMAVSVGRVRESKGYIKLWLLSHNTLRGGAGGSVLNAELAVARKLL
ncbi:MAG: aspartate-semialdehyde dehydrogenase [Methanomassiliicoccales archaeon]|nr:aspartate-semialdehyde dehydrogenase [Methanomassiliicoccales archaeon]